jgi:hypothetical protein
VWHASGTDGHPLRRHFLEAILPPFTALLRRWRPLLSGIHGLTDWEGRSPLSFEDRALANDAMPLEAAVALLAPTWAATFASPPASMSLAVAAAGASEPKNPTSRARASYSGEASPGEPQLNRDRSSKSVGGDSSGRERAAAKAAAAAAAREKERAAKVTFFPGRFLHHELFALLALVVCVLKARAD